MGVIASADSFESRTLARELLATLIGSDGRVRFKSIGGFHCHVTNRYHFQLLHWEVFNDGRHIFYMNGKLLLRVKTNGTKFRKQPHMTLSWATGIGWDDELAKFNRQGQTVRKIGVVKEIGTNWRALARLGSSVDQIAATDDRWANGCHFDFPRGFAGTGSLN